MELFPEGSPLGHLRLIDIHGGITPDGIDGLRGSPDFCGQALLNFDRQAAAYKITMGMILSITIVLSVKDHAALARIFVRMVFGMAHFPV